MIQKHAGSVRLYFVMRINHVECLLSQAGVSPMLIKYHATYLIDIDDVHTRS